MRNIYALLLLPIIILFSKEAQAQLIITSTGTPYTQDFNTLAQSGFPNTQNGGIFDAGWSFLEAGSNANGNYSVGTTTSTVGDTYSFGLAGVNAIDDRAIGVLQSSSLT